MSRTSRRLSALLTSAAGSADMTVDGSSTPVVFTLDPPAGVIYVVQQVILTLHSTSMDLTSAADLRVFGASGTLSNGIQMYESRGTPAVEVQVFPTAVKRVVDFYRYLDLGVGDHIRGHTDGISAGTDFLSVAIGWDSGRELTLRSTEPDLLTLKVRDDLSGLTLFEAHAIGKQYLS